MRSVTVGVVDIGETERKYVNDVLDSNRLSAGKYTRTFEQSFASRHDCRHGVLLNSGTSALQVALATLKEVKGWKDGDEVIVPAVTFIATSNIVLYNGMMPKFVDVDPQFYNIDPSRLEAAITPRTRAVIPVHLFGLPCDMHPILDVAQRYGLAIIEDSCETMFARYGGRSVGSFGTLACFSTYVAHLLVTGVGGIITTNSDEYALICRSLMAHGRDSIYLNIDDDDNVSDSTLREIVARRFSFVRLGFSYRLTELEAALGLAQLERADEIISRRRANAKLLTERLQQYRDFLQLPAVLENCDHSFMMFPIVVKDGLERDDLVNSLEKRGVETRYMLPLLNQPIYRRLFGDLEKRYPVAAWINRSGFYIGCHHMLSVEDIDYVAEVFGEYIASH